MNRGHAFRQLVLARLREFFREPIAIFWVYGFPLLLACVLGAAFSNSRVNPPSVDVVPPADTKLDDQSYAAAGLVKTLKDNSIDVHVFDVKDARKRLAQAKTALIIDDRPEGVTYIFDPTRPDGVHAKYWIDSVLARASSASGRQPDEEKVTAPGSRYIDFLFPGLVGLNLMGGGLFGVGFVLVEMRVRKLFKRLMATPIHRGDFLLAMLSSRLLFLTPEMLSLLGVACGLAGVEVKGSWATLVLVIVTGAMSFAGIGLLLGCRTEKTETMSGLMNLVMLPSYLLCGVFFSSKNYPDAMQPLIQALPLTHLNDALREVMLEGASLANIGWHLLILAAWGVVSFVLALRWFKWT
jgi:ABC-2 type transport system permease protein